MQNLSVGDFTWPNIVPTGQRNPDTKSGTFAKSLKSVTLSFSDGRKFDLTEKNTGFDEYLRLCLLCGIMGVWSGPKNIQHAGYILAAMANFQSEINDDKELNEAVISVTWNGNKFPMLLTVHDLLRLVNFLGKLISESYRAQEDTPESETE